MHLFNAARLADDLRHDRLSERQKVGYLMASLAFTTLFSRSPGLLSDGLTVASAAAMLAFVALSLGGIWYCFTANARGDGRAFIERFFCLNLPILLAWTLAMAITAYAVRVAASVLGVPDARFDEAYRAWSPIVYMAVLPLYYLAMGHYVARAAGAGSVSP